MTLCAYCGHTYAEHAGPRCWGEQRALPTGWRSCRCTEYREAEAPVPVDIVDETEPPVWVSAGHGDWSG